MPEFADMINLVAPELPGCPDPLIEKAFLDISRIFCRDSTVYRKELTPVTLVSGQGDYVLVAPDNYEVISISQAWYNGIALLPLTRRPVRKPTGNAPSYYLSSGTNAIGVHPIPNDIAAGGEVEVEGILRPTLDATGAAEEILERWEDEIVAGVLSRLMSNTNKAWSNPDGSMRHAISFRRGVSKALLQSHRGNTPFAARVYPEVF